ncbi:MAG: IS110 family transposase, partial [Salinisphaera sp.]
FHMIQHQQPYRDTSVDYQALSIKRNAPRWIKMLIQHGYIAASA